MRHLKLLLYTVALLIAASIPSSAVTYFIYEGSCTEPGKPVITQGILSTTPAQINHIPCQVQVYIHGTTNPPIGGLFADDLGTPLSNPFNSQANGYYHFEVSTAGEYDVVLSNTTTGPPTLPPWTSPLTFTISGIQLGASGGSPGSGCIPGGSPNDVQSNNGSGGCQGSSGQFQYNPSTHQVTISGVGGLNVTNGAINFGATASTIPNYTGLTSTILTITCGAGWTAFATDAINGQNIYLCGNDGMFHQATGALPGFPGSGGQIFFSNNAGGLTVAPGFYFNSGNGFMHIPSGLSIDSTVPFSAGGLCPVSAPLGVSSPGQGLIGWDIDCTPKISPNGLGPYAIGLQSLIDYTYQKDDANGCWALTAVTGDVGICRINTGVLFVMNPQGVGSNLFPAKLGITFTYTSPTNYDILTLNWVPSLSAYYIGPDHGSLSGAYHPLYVGGSGPLNAGWGFQINGTLTCLTSNANCDIGSITTSQQLRNIWQNGFFASSITGPTYPVNSAGVQVGLVAKASNTNPVQVQTATTTDILTPVGIVGAVSNGTIGSVFIANPGSGYTAPTCQVSTPTLNSGVGATCNVTSFAGGTINSVAITNIGANNGYQSIQATTITITDPNGTGAVIIPIITATAGFALIAQNGSTFSPIFDGPVSIRNQVVSSITVNGELHDSGTPCASTRLTSVKVFGCTTVTSSGGAGTSDAMQVDMTNATEYVLLGVTPNSTTCPTAGSIGSLCKDTINLSPAFPDANYWASCYPASITSGQPGILAILTADKGAGLFKVQVVAQTGSAAQIGTYDCDVRHK